MSLGGGNAKFNAEEEALGKPTTRAIAENGIS
jgi:hypothetical protein